MFFILNIYRRFPDTLNYTYIYRLIRIRVLRFTWDGVGIAEVFIRYLNKVTTVLIKQREIFSDLSFPK